MRTALGNADYSAWSGCLCCGRVDADAYVPIAQTHFVCYGCLDKLQATRERNAKAVRRMMLRRRIDSLIHPWRGHCRHRGV